MSANKFQPSQETRSQDKMKILNNLIKKPEGKETQKTLKPLKNHKNQ